MAKKQETIDLATLQAANLPVVTVEDVLQGSRLQGDGQITEANIIDRAAFAEYLTQFTPGTEPPACPGCESKAGVEWSIAHGQAHCYRCGYPCRVYHYGDNTPGLKDVVQWVCGLWVHPSHLVERKSV